MQRPPMTKKFRRFLQCWVACVASWSLWTIAIFNIERSPTGRKSLFGLEFDDTWWTKRPAKDSILNSDLLDPLLRFLGLDNAAPMALVWYGVAGLLVIQSALAVLGLVFHFTSRFRHAGMCACGYDLRATPDRCPECGRRPTVES